MAEYYAIHEAIKSLCKVHQLKENCKEISERSINPQFLKKAGAYLIKSLLLLRKESLKRYGKERKRNNGVSILTKVSLIS
ncbi:hypothetical protein AAKU52_000180 [Pedobacter sp. CG_S7]